MIFRSIRISEGMFSKTFDFSSGVNLIHSKQNSKGKTTLLRFLLYSIGYSIPNTRKIRFERCEVEAVVKSEHQGDILLHRNANNHIIVTVNGERITYVLPEQLHELHSMIFGTENPDILRNLLGAFYVDQEKGWTLLNRGVAIGSIHFNIEELIRGLSGRDCNELISQEERLSRELGKYRQMFSVAKYKETLEREEGSLAIDPYEESANNELEMLRIQEGQLRKELHRLDRALNDNKRFRKFVSEMKLLIQGQDGTKIPVTADNIVGFNDSIEYLVAKHKLVSGELSSIIGKIRALEKRIVSEDEQISFWESESITQAFDKRISSLRINAVSIEREIRRLETELRTIRQAITDFTKTNNDVVSALYADVVKYAVELGVGSDETMAASYLFTSNLKELSGAVLHKTVFAFRLAYITEIEKTLQIKLPIILDSPSGKEIDQENIQLMINILKRDFADNQIIIASIFEYAFDSVNVIEIVNRLIE